MIGVIDRVSGAIDRALLAVGCLFLVAMMVHITADVLMRSVFDTSVLVTLELVSYYYMVFAVFLPLSYVERRHQHIQVDLFVQMMPARVQLALYVVACVVGLAFFGALAYQSFLDAVQATAQQQTIMSNFLFYIWPSRWALPIGFAATCLALANNMLTALVRRQPL